jgi:ubiquinone/menaquinone biosynthesis C-methylase UbiE
MNLTSIERKIIETSFWERKRNQEITDLFTGIDQKNKSILNVGAGRSSKSVRANISEDVSKLIQVDRENLEGIDMVVDATNLQFEDNSFDIVLFLRVLHHIDDYNKALSEALRIIKPGGLILLSEPYKYVISAIKLIGLDSHPKNIVAKKDILKFASDKNLKTKQLGRLFWFYYGIQIHKT